MKSQLLHIHDKRQKSSKEGSTQTREERVNKCFYSTHQREREERKRDRGRERGTERGGGGIGVRKREREGQT